MFDNKKEFLKNIDKILKLDATCAYKLNICKLFYGEIIDIKKEYTNKINTWLLKSFKQYYIEFSNKENFYDKIQIFNSFIQQFHLPELLNAISQKKCEMFEKIMLEELEKQQLQNNIKISIKQIKSGFINVDDYLLSEEYII